VAEKSFRDDAEYHKHKDPWRRVSLDKAATEDNGILGVSTTEQKRLCNWGNPVSATPSALN
jgi:hypothetical protein